MKLVRNVRKKIALNPMLDVEIDKKNNRRVLLKTRSKTTMPNDSSFLFETDKSLVADDGETGFLSTHKEAIVQGLMVSAEIFESGTTSPLVIRITNLERSQANLPPGTVVGVIILLAETKKEKPEK